MTDGRDGLDLGTVADSIASAAEVQPAKVNTDDESAEMHERASYAPVAQVENRGAEPGTEVQDAAVAGDSVVVAPEEHSGAPEVQAKAQEAPTTPEHLSLSKRPKSRPKIHFRDFAEQYHLHRDHERDIELLRRRQYALWKWLGLAGRLRRVGSWVQDGLVDMMFRSDRAGFARVHTSLLGLTDLFIYHCKRETTPDDSTLDVEAQPSSTPIANADDTFSRLSAGSRTELFSLLHALRSEPNYLTERIKSLDNDQLKILQESLKPQVSPMPSGHSILGRSRPNPKLRMEAFSQGLEDYAASFERSSTLSFLLFNVYGKDQNAACAESKLRLDTWSSICANLFTTSNERYMSFINDILGAFALLSSWGAKQKVELYLMDVLQRGAFLVDQVQKSPASGRESRGLVWNALETDEARQFFEEAVINLFRILDDRENGIPDGALQLCCAIIAKLPTVEQQSTFRGHFLFNWTMSFLQRALCFPENESMLLHCHISKDARDSVLDKLFQRTQERIYEQYPDDELATHIGHMTSRLEGQTVDSTGYANPEETKESSLVSSVLVLSARDLVQAIDSLFHPHLAAAENADPFITLSTSAFMAQYAHTAPRLDQLRREVMLLANLAAPVPTVHPCQENWILLGIDSAGILSQIDLRPTGPSMAAYSDCDKVQQAAIRLAEAFLFDRGRAHSKSSVDLSLKEMCEDEYLHGLEHGSRLDALFWHEALRSIRQNYPLSELGGNDTQVFESLLCRSRRNAQRLAEIRSHLERSTKELQAHMDDFKKDQDRVRRHLDRLRVKMWYIADVVHSKPYEETRNVATALANMIVPETDGTAQSESPTRGRTRAGSSSFPFFEPQRKEVITILRAPNEYGGPQKLADPQINDTIRWLRRNNIDNFCRGEERIHRFCMEIQSVSKRLVAETLTESPDLWSSELFQRERVAFDASVIAPPQASMSTRPASVISETLSVTMPWSRSAQKQEGSARSRLSDAFSLPGRKGSFHSISSAKLPREYTGTDRSSSGSSPARTVSASTDAISSLFSPMNGYSGSVSSLSARSRPGSNYVEIETLKAADQREKHKSRFLEVIQQDLICMLLSDLGSPVWSCGSETDAWLQRVNTDGAIQLRLRKRRDLEHLVVEQNKIDKERDSARRRSKRSISAAPSIRTIHRQLKREHASRSETALESRRVQDYPYGQVFQELMDRFSQEIDPVHKLAALTEFRKLAILELQSNGSPRDEPAGEEWKGARSLPTSRRSSFDPRAASSTTSSSKASTLKQSATASGQQLSEEVPERQVVAHMTKLLLGLTTKTLFRDLQYIECFVPAEVLDQSEHGRAFLQFGLAAIEYKKEICRCMIDIADSLAGKDLIKRRTVNAGTAPIALRQAAEYWIIAARENHEVAQRELASLYLQFPDSVPIVTLPLSPSSEVFKDEVRWPDAYVPHNKVCLALHWMQHAASNGDEIAKQRLGERTRKISIR